MLLLAVVLFFVFVGPLLLETVRRVRVVNARERRRRAFNRDQEIRELEYELGFSGERPQRQWTDEPGQVIEVRSAAALRGVWSDRTMRQQLYVDRPSPPPSKPVPAWYEAYRDGYRSGYQESSDKLEVF